MCIWLWNGNVYRVFVSIIYKVYFSLLLNIMLCRCLRTVKISFSFFFVTCFGLCLFLCMHHFYNIKSKKVNRRSLLIHVLQKKLKNGERENTFWLNWYFSCINHYILFRSLINPIWFISFYFSLKIVYV